MPRLEDMMEGKDSRWEFKRLWTRTCGHGFSVQISCHEALAWGNQGPYRWCVYAYIRSSHPLMAEFEGDRIWQKATEDIPFHGGCTYIEYIRDESGEPVCVKVGADYAHLYDEHFSNCKEIPIEVQDDANRLIEWLQAHDAQPGGECDG